MKRRISLIGLMSLIGLAGALFSHAQTVSPPPTLVLTWQAHAYVPSDYPGKILPPRGSSVDVSLLATDRGKIIDLSRTDIAWSVNGRHLNGGIGMTYFSFVLDQFTARTYTITASIRDWQGLPNMETSVAIRRADPMIVIDAPYSKHLLTDQSAELTVIPYFFLINTVSDLTVSWEVNNKDINQQVNKLLLGILNASAGQTITVQSEAVNNNNAVESAADTQTFIVAQ